jgi:DNA-binding GntR family transcriptional regulator
VVAVFGREHSWRSSAGFICPPSTLTATPLTKLAWSEPRKKHTAGTISHFPSTNGGPNAGGNYTIDNRLSTAYDGVRSRAVEPPAIDGMDRRTDRRRDPIPLNRRDVAAGARAHAGAPAFRRPTTLAVEIARHLREAIIRGEIHAGERLNETRLTQQFTLSRSPVREALRILEAEGLVILEPHRGARVRRLSGEDLREIFDLRLMFETHALQHRRNSLTPEALAPLAGAGVSEWHEASLRFHDGLVALAGNRHLQQLHDGLKLSLQRYQLSLIGFPRQPERWQAAHEAILGALERGDLDRAHALVAGHLTALQDALLTAIALGLEAGGPA